MYSHSLRFIRPALLLSMLLLVMAPLGLFPQRAAASSIAADRETVINTSTGQEYIVYGGIRHLVSTPQVSSLLGLAAIQPTKLTAGQIATLPEGPALTVRLVNGAPYALSPVASGAAAIGLGAPAVLPGQAFRLRGIGFAPGEAVQISYAYNQVFTIIHANQQGQFSMALTTPLAVTPTVLRVFAFGETSKILQVEPVTVLQRVVAPRLDASPARLYPGGQVTVDGVGFSPNEMVSVYFTAGGTPIEVAANATGAFHLTGLIAPAAISAGSHTITATGRTSHRSVKATVTIVALPIVKPLLQASALQARAGDKIYLSGVGFSANEAVLIRLSTAAGVEIRADAAGKFAAMSYTIGASLSAGKYAITALGLVSGRTAAVAFTVAATPQANVVPADGTLVRDQSTGRVYLIWAGTRHWILNEATLQALGFNDSTPINMQDSVVDKWPNSHTLSIRLVAGRVFPLSPIISGNSTLRLSVPSGAPGAVFTIHGDGYAANEAVQIAFAGTTTTVAANGAGSFDASAAVPATAIPGSILDIVAYGTISRVFQIEPFAVISPAAPATVTVPSGTAAQGATAIYNATGFLPGEQVNVFLAQGANVANAFADAAGNITGAGIHVPSSLSVGAHTFFAFGLTSKRYAATTISITVPAPVQAHIFLDRTAANAGSLVRIRGTGFAGNEPVKITLGSITVLVVTAGANGAFSTIGFTVPTTTQPGPLAVTATGQISGRLAVAGLTIVAFNPTLSLSPLSATPGTSITVSGQGFAPGEIITLALNGQALVTHPGVIRANSSGAFAATFTVPETALSGANTLAASGATSRGSATATLTVNLPVQSTWYFAGGNTNSGYSTQIALVNTNGAPATVTVSFMFSSGVPMPYTTTVPARSRSTIDVGSIVGVNRDVFTVITADRKIGASETLFRNGQDFSSTIGASAPLRTWYLAEGYTGLSFHEYIRIFNPGGIQAHADVRLLPFNGRPATSVAEVVNPQSGMIVDVNAIESGLSLSAIVDSDQPIVVERLITFGPGGYGATEQVGSNTPSSTWLFAEGSTVNNFETYFTILNPSASQPAAVTATFFDSAGNVLGNDTVVIDPLRRGNIKVNDFVRSSGIATILTANIPVVAERPLYFGSPNGAAAGGSDVFGRNGGGVTWLFPEGNTSTGFTEFLLLQNPSSQAAPVTVRFYQTNGVTVDYNVVLPAKSRATVDVLRNVPSLPAGFHSALVRSTSGVPIIAEQSIYSDNFTKGDGEAGIAQ